MTVAAADRGERRQPEDVADDSGVLERALVAGRQRVQAGCDQRLQRVGNRKIRKTALEQIRVCEEPHHFLREQRIAVRTLEDRPPRLLGDAPRNQRRDELGRLLLRQRRKRDCLRIAAFHPCGSAVVELWARRADDEQRHPVDALAELGKELEQSKIGPVKILDHDHRTLVRDRREEAVPRGERLLPACRLPRIDTQQRQQPGPQPRLLLHVRQDCVKLVGRSLGRVRFEDAGMHLDDLPERPERDPVSVREAAAASPDRRSRQPTGKLVELGQQPTLPDPRLADDRQKPPAAFVQRRVQRSPEPFHFRSAADQAHRSRGGGSCPGRKRTPHGHRLRLALCLDRIEPLVVEQALRLTIGQLADCDSSHRRG
jgi:hypothetical protein